jgi:hypothetical protein
MTLFAGPPTSPPRRAQAPRSLHSVSIGQFTLADAAPSIWFIMLVGLLSVLALGSISMIEAASRAQHELTFLTS